MTVKWSVTTHQWMNDGLDTNHCGYVDGYAFKCDESYWEHKWNPHTMSIWRQAALWFGILCFLIGVMTAIVVIVITNLFHLI